MKIATGKISSILIDERQKLNDEISDRLKLEAEIAEKTKNVKKTKDQLEVIEKKRGTLDKKKKFLEKVLEDLLTK